MKIITSGSTFFDIDAYASAIAYAELLNLSFNNSLSVANRLWLRKEIVKQDLESHRKRSSYA